MMPRTVGVLTLAKIGDACIYRSFQWGDTAANPANSNIQIANKIRFAQGQKRQRCPIIRTGGICFNPGTILLLDAKECSCSSCIPRSAAQMRVAIDHADPFQRPEAKQILRIGQEAVEASL